MITRYTFKDLRIINHLTIDELSQKTGIKPDDLILIELDSREAEWCDIVTLSRFYKISANYIYIGKQSDFSDKCITELLDSDLFHAKSLSKRINIAELLELEKRLSLPNLSLYNTILQLEGEVINDRI